MGRATAAVDDDDAVAAATLARGQHAPCKFHTIKFLLHSAIINCIRIY